MTAVDITQLYDARRDCYYDKPLLRGWVHAAAFVAAVLFGIALIADAASDSRSVVASVYAVSVVGLFGASTLYHRGSWTAPMSRRLQRLDHTMIIVLIAGTATPPMALSLTGSLRVAALALLWSLAAVAVLVRLMWMTAPEILAGSIYLGLGWIAGAAVPAVWIRHGVGPAVLLLAGGVLYMVGALGYHHRFPNPRPSVFGYHEVFHTYVTAAAACQYVAIGCFLL
ncbi:MAG TPA: hemolysin III family protein [Jatrophihabitans sp.]|jgi:hemolysin III|nr:hemolysin III family protein [Jatrophihabitans sp.]